MHWILGGLIGALYGAALAAATHFPTAAAAPSHVWAKKIGGPNEDQARGIAVDAGGNVYITGSFAGTADFDPGPGTFNLTAAGPTDIFLSKLNSVGTFLWARRIGGGATDMAFGVAVDNAGAVYTAGFSTNSAGNNDVIIAKRSNTGSPIWVRRFSGGFYAEAYSIAVDEVGSVYSTGQFFETVDFDPGPASANLVCPPGTCMFVSKLDSAGNYLWAKKGWNSDGGPLSGIDLTATIDAIYVTGLYDYVAHFAGCFLKEPGPEHARNSGGFIFQLDPDGNCTWAARIENIGRPDPNGVVTSLDISRSVAVDPSGTIYVTGEQNDRAFVQKTGSWKKLFGGAYDDRSFGVAVDSTGNVYTAGYSIAAAGDADLLLTKRDSAGTKLWSRKISGQRSVLGFGLALDSAANIYVTGRFLGTVDFDPGPGTSILAASGSSSDAFILKLAQ